MKKLNQNELLDYKIALLTIQQKQELFEVKEQFKIVQESISPSNLVQEGLQKVYETVTNKNHLIPTVLSIIGGYISKKAIIGNSDNPLKKVLGTILQFIVTNYLNTVNSNEETLAEKEEHKLNKSQ